MRGLYIGSTSGYSGKNMIVMGIGLKMQKDGLNIGYMKPVGAMPVEVDGKLGDDDAIFVQDVLGLDEDPAQVTPVVVTQDFKVKAFTGKLDGLSDTIAENYEELAKDRDLTLVAGSGSMYSGKYCDTDAITIIKKLGIKAVIIDRFEKEFKYDYLAVMKEQLGDQLVGVILNDVPSHFMEEVNQLLAPFFERRGIKVLGVIPRDPLMGAIKVGDLADRLGGKIISAHNKADRVVESFLIGTMQVENFMTHFRKKKNSAIIVGGDRSDVQLVALEGDCPCLVLTGNLYPNDIILTRSEVLETPIIMVREDTYSVAKKMDSILSRHKLRDAIKIKQGADLVAENIDFQHIKKELGL
ncbi:phosphotransacetylase family protein [Salidesulfovibrio brasiliensis]|uniref:phosphotransacetylase family protein n=1 Tax=Salidesulfovibrio brasiliensis TaxID=221711 RepID=UPI0006D14BA3|nr:phosphotransacetylase family protein [Salidesulfovibrio brasiliensis]